MPEHHAASPISAKLRQQYLSAFSFPNAVRLFNRTRQLPEQRIVFLFGRKSVIAAVSGMVTPL